MFGDVSALRYYDFYVLIFSLQLFVLDATLSVVCLSVSLLWVTLVGLSVVYKRRECSFIDCSPILMIISASRDGRHSLGHALR